MSRFSVLLLLAMFCGSVVLPGCQSDPKPSKEEVVSNPALDYLRDLATPMREELTGAFNMLQAFETHFYRSFEEADYQDNELLDLLLVNLEETQNRSAKTRQDIEAMAAFQGDESLRGSALAAIEANTVIFAEILPGILEYTRDGMTETEQEESTVLLEQLGNQLDAYLNYDQALADFAREHGLTDQDVDPFRAAPDAGQALE